MHEIRHLTAADARRVPWKNGRGVTEELALWPPGATFERGDFDWRLARAGVSEPGPFSEFPGFDRVLLVTSGAGLLLRHGADAPPTRATLMQPVRLSGDGPTRAELLDGPVADLNLLLRRGGARGDVQLLRPGAAPLQARCAAAHVLLVLLDGAAQVRGLGAQVALAAGELLWLREAAAEAEISGDATLALVRIDGP